MVAINMNFFARYGLFKKAPGLSVSLAVVIVIFLTASLISMLCMVIWLLVEPAGAAEKKRQASAGAGTQDGESQCQSGTAVAYDPLRDRASTGDFSSIGGEIMPLDLEDTNNNNNNNNNNNSPNGPGYTPSPLGPGAAAGAADGAMPPLDLAENDESPPFIASIADFFSSVTNRIFGDDAKGGGSGSPGEAPGTAGDTGSEDARQDEQPPLVPGAAV
jgi:hypothetical protein